MNISQTNISNFSIIIGTQKGGTTSLFSYLSQHPQVAASRLKEPDFFSGEHNWSRGLEYYESLWEWNPNCHVTALEASPSYTNSVTVAELVVERVTQSLGENCKFIYILRNPVDKIESMRKQGVYHGWYADFLEQETTTTLPDAVIERAKYAAIIDQFVSRFSENRVLLLKMEQMKSNPSAVMRTICDFLGLDSSFEFSTNRIHNARNSYRQDTIWHFLRDLKALKSFREIVPDDLKNKARRILSQPLTKSDKQVLPLTAAQKDYIVDMLSEDMNELRAKYNVDTSDWLR